MSFKEVIIIAKDIASVFSGLAVVAAFIAAWIAWKGLKSWRDQLTGRAEYELARRLLRCVYKVRDEIRGVRNPAILPGEFAEASAESGVEHDSSRPGFSHEQTRAVYHRRWMRLVDALSDLEVEQLEAEVLWGQQVITLLKPLRQCINRLGLNVRRYLNSGDPESRFQYSSERYEEMETIIYETSDNPDEDEFTAEVAAAIDSIEQFIRPYLKL